MRIGFIGTGTMGTPIAGCLVAAGHRLTVYDLRREATETLRQQGAAIGETPRALAEASVKNQPMNARGSSIATCGRALSR